MLEVPNWVINPFSDIEVMGAMEEELTELQNDFDLKPKFKKSFKSFGCRKRSISTHYPSLRRVVKKLFIAFPISYLVEHGFSLIMQLLLKQGNRLYWRKITKHGDLRLLLSDIKPDIRNLVSFHQAHPSH